MESENMIYVYLYTLWHYRDRKKAVVGSMYLENRKTASALYHSLHFTSLRAFEQFGAALTSPHTGKVRFAWYSSYQMEVLFLLQVEKIFVLQVENISPDTAKWN